MKSALKVQIWWSTVNSRSLNHMIKIKMTRDIGELFVYGTHWPENGNGGDKLNSNYRIMSHKSTNVGRFSFLFSRILPLENGQKNKFNRHTEEAKPCYDNRSHIAIDIVWVPKNPVFKIMLLCFSLQINHKILWHVLQFSWEIKDTWIWKEIG